MNTKKNNADVAIPVERRESDENTRIPDLDTRDDIVIPPISRDPDAKGSTGFDPYDSGTFDTSKSWDVHSQFKRRF